MAGRLEATSSIESKGRTVMAVSDEDWFERAVRELEGDADAADDVDADGDDADSDAAHDTTGREDVDRDVEWADSGPAGPAGEGDRDEPQGLFDDDFSTAFERAGLEGVGESTEQASFDEPIDSALPRLDIGIDGLDEMIQGGVPEHSLIAVIGGAGTGKTTFAMQFLNAGLEHGERGVYLTLEQRKSAVVDTATELGWDFDSHIDAGDLAVIEMDPIGMANSLASIRGDLPRLIDDFGADRFVLDSVSLLEMMYDSQSTRRNEIYDFTASLKDAGVTPLLTSEASESAEFASRHGIVEYLTDAVFVLRNIRTGEYQESRLGVEIMKIRNTRHSRETKPFEIDTGGIEVYRQAQIF